MPATKLTATSSLPQGRCAIPASVIFSSRELKRYKQWQRQTATIRASQQGYLPTATEYDDFQRWLAKHDSGYFSDVFEDIAAHIQKSDAESTTKSTFPPLPAMGTICRHLLHPGETNYNMPRCPVCTITVHLTYMEVIQKALEAAGGHPPRSRLSASSEQQENVYQAWCRSKLDTLQELSRLEDLAEKAELWSSEHSTEDIGDVKTSEEALNTYWTRISQPSGSSPPCPTQKSKPKKSKPVAFIEGTDFEPGRPQIYYWRRSPRYDPGKYALAGENDEADTESNPNDSSHDQKAKTSSEKTWSDAMSNVEEGNHEGARYEWDDTSSLGEEESDSDSDGEVEEEEDYVVFEDDDDDEGSFIVFDD